ncbi:MAG TPA: heme-copper oxidase subunit III [Streptosporangiaceae bacterium]|nr:heme-copper oxidase subunit III [Streptosporangiaceae bacterium]
MLPVATASAIETTPHARANRPNLVSVGTIVWLSSELMFFAALFAMYFTIRSVTKTGGGEWPGTKLNLPFDTFNTVVLVASSITCQMGVFAAERIGGSLNPAKDLRKLRTWYFVSFLMGLWFVIGQAISYTEQIQSEHLTLSSSAYGSVFYLTTGFHGLHVTGGLIAFLFVLGRTFAAKRWTHEQATSTIVVSYYWHFVDVVWIGLFGVIFIIK